MVLPGLRQKAVSIHMKPGGRGKGGGGRSCAGAAAYRSATHLHDHYLEREFDYSRKGGVLHVELTGWPPREGESYAEAQQRLWSEVDRSERRSDSRTFWDLRFTLPRELTVEQQVAVCREIAAVVNRKFGVAIDWALHESHRLRGGRWSTHPSSNPHAHMGLTTREPEGEGKFRPAKQMRLYARRALLWIRRMIARVQNEHLKRLDHGVRVTHRSLAAEYRKLNRGRAAAGLLPLETPEATRHRGPRATHRARRAETCRIEEENHRIRDRNRTVLRFNDKVTALDGHIRRHRERENLGAAASPIPDPLPVAALPREDAPEPMSPVAPLPEGEGAPSIREMRRAAEERVLELKRELHLNQENRRTEERLRAKVEELVRRHFPERSAGMLRTADDPERWRQLVPQLRMLALEKPGLVGRLASRLHSGARSASEQRSRDLSDLAGALEAMWRARTAVLPDEERAGHERELRQVVEKLGFLNAAEKEQRDQARALRKHRLDPFGRDHTDPRIPDAGSLGR